MSVPQPTPRAVIAAAHRYERRDVATTTTPPNEASSIAAATASAVASAKNSGNGNNGFYSNQLFYILIAVLGAFAIVSIINLTRTRRRRRIIIREAESLGLMVPGMPGYVPMRERPALVKADGWRNPQWWEVADDKDEKPGGGAPGAPEGTRAVTEAGQAGASEKEKGADLAADEDEAKYGARGKLVLPPLDELRPLALIPEPVLINEPPKPWSSIPYFPNYVSYLRSAHDPKPPRFAPGDPHAFDSVMGEDVQVVVALRMPAREIPPPATGEAGGDDDDDAVMREWSGLELAVASVRVESRQ